MIACMLCGIEFDESDILIKERKRIHQRFHTNCRKEKRNSIEGQVKWEKIKCQVKY